MGPQELASWERLSGKPSFESTFFSKPQTQLPKRRLTQALKLLKIQLICIRGVLLWVGKSQRSATIPPNLLMEDYPSCLPEAKGAFMS